jgi:outer membrane lipoprotein SlyB
LATIAGAVGGGYAGNEIEKRRSSTTTYEVIVRMDNGGRQRFMMREQRWASGDLVRVVNGTLVAR